LMELHLIILFFQKVLKIMKEDQSSIHVMFVNNGLDLAKKIWISLVLTLIQSLLNNIEPRSKFPKTGIIEDNLPVSTDL